MELVSLHHTIKSCFHILETPGLLKGSPAEKWQNRPLPKLHKISQELGRRVLTTPAAFMYNKLYLNFNFGVES